VSYAKILANERRTLLLTADGLNYGGPRLFALNSAVSLEVNAEAVHVCIGARCARCFRDSEGYGTTSNTTPKPQSSLRVVPPFDADP
jgi:hypothetical protein